MKKSISTIVAASLVSSVALATIIKQGPIIDARKPKNQLEEKKPDARAAQEAVQEVNAEDSIDPQQLELLQAQFAENNQEEQFNPENIDYNNITAKDIKMSKLPMFPVYDYQLMLYYYGMKSQKSFVELLMTATSPEHLPKEIKENYYISFDNALAAQKEEIVAKIEAKTDAGEELSEQDLYTMLSIGSISYRAPFETYVGYKQDGPSGSEKAKLNQKWQLVKQMYARFGLSDDFHDKRVFNSRISLVDVLSIKALPELLDFLNWSERRSDSTSRFFVTAEEKQAIQELIAYEQSMRIEQKVSILDWDNLRPYSIQELQVRGQQWQMQNFSPKAFEDAEILAKYRKNQAAWVQSLIQSAKENLKNIDPRRAPKLAMAFYEKKTESGYGDENPLETAEAIEAAKERKKAMNLQEELYQRGIYEETQKLPENYDFVPESEEVESDVPTWLDN